MGRRPRHQAGLDPDQAAALRGLARAFGAEQVTDKVIQATESAGRDLTVITTPVQASLLEEAS